MKKYIKSDFKERCKTITLGIDPSVYYKDISKRDALRERWGFKESDIIIMSGGSMTRNKGIPEVLATLGIIVCNNGNKHVKLLLKGTQELYDGRTMVESYMDDLIRQGILTKESARELLDNNIKFIESSVVEGALRHLYNAVDLYLSPYLAEGFNMMVLEAIACGTRVLVSKGGATDDFIDNLMSIKDASKYIYRFETKVTEALDGKRQLLFSLKEIIDVISVIDFKYKSDDYIRDLAVVMHKKYSWESIAKEIYEYFKSIIDDMSLTDKYNVDGVNKTIQEEQVYNETQDIKESIKRFIREN
jgi:glycosyltransferase involved in cell wall biosynthesis